MISDSEWAAIKAELQTQLQTSRKGSSTYVRRQENTKWILELPLGNLEFNSVEMQIPILTTRRGEKIVIQYPGKESGKDRKMPNERDFRPKIVGAGVDLSFQQIWDPLFYELNRLEGEEKERVGRVLATLFYRMAYMVDYNKDSNKGYTATAVRMRQDLVGRALPPDATFASFWLYKPPPLTLDVISRILPNWAEMSFESFLHYNSLLAWNEDSKYSLKLKDIWSPAKRTGRINTLTTHVKVIGFILGKIRPSTLLGGFAAGRGVAPANARELKLICDDLIV